MSTKKTSPTQEELRQHQENITAWQERLNHQREFLETTEGQTGLGIPPQYHGAKSSDHPHGEILKAWITDPYPALVTLTGGAGTGKTRLLYALVRNLLWNLSKPFIYSVPDFCWLASNSAIGDSQERFFVRNLINTDNFVFLDDLGAEKTTDFVLQELYRLISQRELWDKPLLITTNLSIEQIGRKLDDRIASRLAGGLVLEFSGSDRRLDSARSRT